MEQIDKTGEVTTSIEELAIYNMVLSEAIYEILADKGVLTRAEATERIKKLKSETKVTYAARISLDNVRAFSTVLFFRRPRHFLNREHQQLPVTFLRPGKKDANLSQPACVSTRTAPRNASGNRPLR